MKNQIKILLREGLENLPKIKYEFESVDYYDGQRNMELGMYLDGEIVGMIQYVLFEGEITISNILVRPEFRRRGFGSRMMIAMKKNHPDYKYKPSLKSDLGGKFIHKDIDNISTLDN